MTNTEDDGIETSLDMDWLVSLNKRVLDTKLYDRSTKPTIYRVPNLLKSVDPQAYEPLLVLVGPYHRNRSHLQAMNQLKWKCLKYVVEQRPGMFLEDYVDLIKKLETRARDAYSEEVDMDSNSFVEMMLLDGCFLMLTIMRRNYYCIESASSLTPHVVLRDIFMLENQLPFFLLETLYESAFPPHSSFRQLTLKFIGMHFSTKLRYPSNNIETYHHLIHLFLSCIDSTTNHGIGNGNQSSTFGFLCNSISKPVKTIFVSLPSKLSSSFSSLVKKIRTGPVANPEEDLDDSPWIPSATVCKEAGIHFVRKKRGKSFLDITFQNGKLEIPQLRIEDHTDSLLRNLIAYEQCSTDSKFHVTSYVVLMDYLINTEADVELLQQQGIIINDLGGTQQIATLFNKLGTYVCFNRDDFYLEDVVITAIKKHRDTRCNKWRARRSKWRATLKREYFSHPWSAISLFGQLSHYLKR